ncbi:MAG TPA: hypothetical protein VJ695_03935 [Nitrososphaera sp.]|nr:hypothetical protein [Nitrososphaera sp.]
MYRTNKKLSGVKNFTARKKDKFKQQTRQILFHKRNKLQEELFFGIFY